MQNTNHHGLVTRLTLRDGRSVLVRPLAAGDAEALSGYFGALSERSRATYGPHAFDVATAQRLCAQVADDTAVRFVAMLEDTEPAQIIGYMILEQKLWPDDIRRYGGTLDAQCSCLAPSIADDFQGQGLGTAMAKHVLASARLLGLSQVILMGGVIRRNERAVRLYQRLGFRQVREFWTHGREDLLNDDMILDLNL